MSVTYRLILPDQLDETLQQVWRTIQQGDAAYSSPCFCPEYTLAVSRVRDDVRIVVIEQERQPVGFFAYQHAGWRFGRPVGGAFSDYHGVIVRPGIDWQVEAVLREAGLSIWVFDHLSGATSHFQPYVRNEAHSPVIDLSNGFETFERYLKEAASDFMPHTRRMARKLAREVGELRFVLHEPDALAQVIEWKSAQYRRGHPAGKDVVFTNPWTTALLREILAVQQADFAGVCSALYAGDRLVAAHMGMRSRSDWHYWFPAYDPDFSKYSPGSVLMLRMAEAAQSQGIQVIDLGKGASRYKSTLMTGKRPLQEGSVELPSIRTTVRKVLRAAELRQSAGGTLLPTLLNLPVRAIRKIERMRRFR